MPKKIVLLSDGTGNSAARFTKTNVWRCYEALDLSDPGKQIAFYDDGVGTSSFRPLALLGGAFGYGIKRNVLDLYTFLCRNYEEGDEIYIFGFSRGAFTACIVAGLIASEGIVSAETEQSLQENAAKAYREYRRNQFTASLPFDSILRSVRDVFLGRGEYLEKRKSHSRPDIRLLGVWDTVGAYGLPIDEMTRALNWFWRLYPSDRDVPRKILRVRHAMAIDDERHTFHPLLFNEENEPVKQQIKDERISQVWFAGMHSNVGGGYPDDGLSLVSLKWMLDCAEQEELAFETQTRKLLMLRLNAVGMLYDSRKGLGGLYRYKPRNIEHLCNQVLDKDRRVIVKTPKIHESVLRRIALGSDRYAPIGIPRKYAVVSDGGAIISLDSPNAKSVCESPEGAAGRFDRQNHHVWDLVWCKRLAYFSSIIVASVLFVLPLVAPYQAACKSSWACSLVPLINAAGALVPGFAERWVASYKSYPDWFSILAIAFGILLWIGKKLQVRIRDGMRSYWDRSLGNSTVTEADRPSTLYRIRESGQYKAVFRAVSNLLLPFAFAVLSTLVIAGQASRFVFSTVTAAGRICSEQPDLTASFPVSSSCFNTGYELSEGKKYLIKLRAKVEGSHPAAAACSDSVTLCDKKIPTGLGGHSATYLMPFVPFRRYVGENWFKPVARIGDKGNDDYILNPVDGPPAKDTTGELTAEITARRSGKLYLFVNDAVLPGPASWQYFYSNNRGEIAFKVVEIDAVTGLRKSHDRPELSQQSTSN